MPVKHRERADGVHDALHGLLDRFEALPFDTVVVEGIRTKARQQALYDQGRTTPGNIVTKAKPEQSPHCHAAALDIMPLVDGKLLWVGTIVDSRLAEMGAIAAELGLTWGGTWKFRDADHFEVPGWQQLPLVC